MWPHGSHGGLPRLPGCRCLRAQAGRLLSQGGWRDSGEQRVAHRQRLWSAAGCMAKDPWNPRKNRAPVGQGPILGHAHCTPGSSGANHCSFSIPLRPAPVSLTSLPASPHELLHLLRGMGSPAPRQPVPAPGASSCPAHGGASSLGTSSRNSFPRNPSHRGGKDRGWGASAGCHLLSTIFSVLPGRLPVKTHGLQGDRPPSAPVCSLVPLFLVH